jgi:TP901 family phage tail tape measure protein
MQLKEEAVFTLKFDGKPVINELGELEKRLIDVKDAQKSVERGTKEWADNKAEIKELEASIKSVREEMGVSGMTVKQLEGYYKQLNREIKDLTPGTDAYKAKMGDLQEVNSALNTHRQTIRGVGDEVEKQPSLWDRAKAGVMTFFAAFGAMELLQRAFSFVQDGIKSALELSDTFGKVSKATGQTAEQVQHLADELDKVDTRTTKEGLLEIAQIGGQLGVANDQLVGFVQSVDMAAVALSDEFSGGAEEAANKLGGLQKLFVETKDLKAGEAITKIGSALNDLGAAGTATAPVVADFTARIGQLGDLAPEITQTMGLGAAFQELGLSAEIAAGGLTNVLLTAAKDTATFAKQLGISEVAMKQLINTNPNEFLLKLAESLRGLPADEVAKQLDNLGIKSQEATKVMSLLKDQTALVREKQDLANKSFAEGTSLQKEFNTMNTTANAEYQKSQKNLAQLATEIGQNLLPGITKVTQGTIAFVNIIRAIPEFVSENSTAFTALGVALLAFNGHLILAEANSIRVAAVEKARLIWTEAGTAAQWLLNTAMTANPIALVVTAVALLVAGFVTLYNHSTTVRAGIAGLFTALQVAAGQLVLFWEAITSLNFAEAAKIISEGGAKIAAGFNKGYQDEVKKGQPGQLTDHTAHVGKLTGISTAGAKDAAASEVAAHGTTLTTKEQAAQKSRDAEAKRAADAAKKEADEAIKANNDALKKIEDLRIDSIKNDLEREIAKIRAKRDAEVEAAMASKASAEVKAEWEKALNEKMLRDIAAAEEKSRIKHEKDEADTAKRVFDLKIKISGDEKADKLQKLEDIATAQRAQVQKEIADEIEKAALLAKINDNLIAAKKQVEEAYRKKKADEEKSLQDQLYQATVADANARLQLAGSNATAIYNAKKERLDAEYQYNKAKLEREAAEQKAHNEANIADTDRRAAANKATDDKLKSDLTSNDKKYETDKTELTKEKTEARRQNQQEYFTAIKALMDGDFKTFTDILTKKLAGENKQLTESQQKQISTIDAVGEYTVMASQALMKLSQLKLDKELANIKKDKDSQLAAWKEKYDKGLIGKDEFETGVDKINKEADQKIKQAQLDAWKRQQKIDITTAIALGIMSALKSLATLGWPLGLIAAAGSAIATAVQISKIKSQQPPSLASGGKIRNAGVPDGPRHGTQYGASGISLVRRDTGQEVGEMEGQEPIMVLSRNTYANNRNVVDSLLHSSLHRNGAPIMKHGGIFGSDGGSYGDYLQNGGLRRFADGGWMDQINEGGGSSGGSDGGGDSSGGSSNNESFSESVSDADMKDKLNSSQKTQDDIAKNTLAAATALDKALGLLADLQAQVKLESTNQQTALLNQMTGLRTDIGIQLQALQFAMHTDMTALQGTMKVEFPSLGADLLNQLDSLRTSLVLTLIMVRNGIGLDVTNLQKATTLGLDTLGKTVHTDLTQLETLLHADMTTLQENVHLDLSTLDTNVDTSLTALATNVHADLGTMQLAQARQQATLLTETKLNFSTLQTILKQELELLQLNTHTDLNALTSSNSTELRAVQGILTGSRNEQGYHSALLRIISEKNLSVQTFVNVFNQIDVVVGKSDLK